MSNGKCFIGIDPFEIETTAEERVHLAHEIGHCETLSFYNIYSSLDIREKHEEKADRWAVSRLIPACELAAAIKCGYCETWSLAEFFDVTEDFIRKAIRIYKVKGMI